MRFHVFSSLLFLLSTLLGGCQAPASDTGEPSSGVQHPSGRPSSWLETLKDQHAEGTWRLHAAQCKQVGQTPTPVPWISKQTVREKLFGDLFSFFKALSNDPSFDAYLQKILLLKTAPKSPLDWAQAMSQEKTTTTGPYPAVHSFELAIDPGKDSLHVASLHSAKRVRPAGTSEEAWQYNRDLIAKKVQAWVTLSSASVEAFDSHPELLKTKEGKRFLIWKLSPRMAPLLSCEAGKTLTLAFRQAPYAADTSAHQSFDFIKPNLVGRWKVDRYQYTNAPSFKSAETKTLRFADLSFDGGRSQEKRSLPALLLEHYLNLGNFQPSGPPSKADVAKWKAQKVEAVWLVIDENPRATKREDLWTAQWEVKHAEGTSPEVLSQGMKAVDFLSLVKRPFSVLSGEFADTDPAFGAEGGFARTLTLQHQSITHQGSPVPPFAFFSHMKPGADVIFTLLQEEEVFPVPGS